MFDIPSASADIPIFVEVTVPLAANSPPILPQIPFAYDPNVQLSQHHYQ